MPFALYDYLSASGINEVLVWARELQTPERAKLNAKLDMLATHGPNLRPHTLTGTDASGIQKLRVHGSVQLRPLLCEGPANVNIEFTLLAGAKEVGSKLKPPKILEVAESRKAEVTADPKVRRVAHVRP
jgi:hypothetical protein